MGAMTELVILIANQSNPAQTKVIEQTKNILSKFKIKIDSEIDGSDDENKEVREQLFDLSGEGGNYPQLFSRDSAGNYEFITTGTEIENMNEMQEAIVEMLKADKDFLEKNPAIKSITEVFKEWI